VGDIQEDNILTLPSPIPLQHQSTHSQYIQYQPIRHQKNRSIPRTPIPHPPLNYHPIAPPPPPTISPPQGTHSSPKPNKTLPPTHHFSPLSPFLFISDIPPSNIHSSLLPPLFSPPFSPLPPPSLIPRPHRYHTQPATTTMTSQSAALYLICGVRCIPLSSLPLYGWFGWPRGLIPPSATTCVGRSGDAMAAEEGGEGVWGAGGDGAGEWE